MRLRVLQLREIQESLGHEWVWRCLRLRELVREANLSACEHALPMQPSRDVQVAWFIFSEADIPGDYLRVGQVQFFSHRLWPEAVTNREFMSRVPGAEFPAELAERALGLLKPEDGSDAHVYARVELVGPRAGFEANRRFVAPLPRGDGRGARGAGPALAELLAENDATADEAVAEVRWYEATRRQTDGARRVASHVRAFERALPRTGSERWNDVVKRYFREFWALDTSTVTCSSSVTGRT